MALTLFGVSDDVDPEAELKKMLADDDLPKHLRLGVINKLLDLRGAPAPVNGNGGPVVMPARDDGLPPDPLLEQFPELLMTDEHGRPTPADPFADLDWAGIVGRPPHLLYARVLHAVPWHPTDLGGKPDRRSEEARILLDAEARFLRRCRDMGLDTEACEIAEKRRRRQRNRRGG